MRISVLYLPCCNLEACDLSGFTGSQLENVASRGIMGLFHPPFRYLGEISDLVLLESLRFWAVGIKCIYFSCEKDVNLGNTHG